MGKIVEIAYFNTFILSGGSQNGSTIQNGEYHIEESRIKGDYNAPSMDYGVKAYAVDKNYGSRKRKNTMIYSGIYNSRTEVNDTNAFPSGQNITKSVDSAYGGINKLFAEETDLTIFQENKIHAALIDKDAIFTAEGGNITTTANVVIGQIRPYQGDIGIGDNPESFAYNNGRKYGVDKDKSCVFRLSRDGITKISDYGMSTFFRDNLKKSDTIRGMYDVNREEYVISLGTNEYSENEISHGVLTNQSDTSETVTGDYITVGFYEGANGWSSFYTYKPSFGFSHNDTFYTFEYGEEDLYKHYDATVQRASFYGKQQDPSYINLIMNTQPSVIKNFLTVNYEGSTGWEAIDISAKYYNNLGYNKINEEAYKIAKEGTIIYDDTYSPIEVGFIRKESEYNAPIKNKNGDYFNDNTFFDNSGVKGSYLDLTLRYWNPNENTAEQIGESPELFTVSSEISLSSQ